jgi:hypothetical protein
MERESILTFIRENQNNINENFSTDLYKEIVNYYHFFDFGEKIVNPFTIDVRDPNLELTPKNIMKMPPKLKSIEIRSIIIKNANMSVFPKTIQSFTFDSNQIKDMDPFLNIFRNQNYEIETLKIFNNPIRNLILNETKIKTLMLNSNFLLKLSYIFPKTIKHLIILNQKCEIRERSLLHLKNVETFIYTNPFQKINITPNYFNICKKNPFFLFSQPKMTFAFFDSLFYACGAYFDDNYVSQFNYEKFLFKTLILKNSPLVIYPIQNRTVIAPFCEKVVSNFVSLLEINDFNPKLKEIEVNTIGSDVLDNIKARDPNLKLILRIISSEENRNVSLIKNSTSFTLKTRMNSSNFKLLSSMFSPHLKDLGLNIKIEERFSEERVNLDFISTGLENFRDEKKFPNLETSKIILTIDENAIPHEIVDSSLLIFKEKGYIVSVDDKLITIQN